MTESQRERVDELFGDLIERDPEEWEAVLADVEDAEVRAEVASLLDHTGPATKSLNTSIGEMMQAATASGEFEDRSIGPGTRFERYRIERRIGQGGMGDVYEAVRDNDFHKRVALKIVRYGLDSDFARGRFQQERQMLAGLEHPFIARLLDGGEAANGCPYLVLEYVDGVPIDVYCQTCSRADILKLFLKVCEAVEYAHRNLIIHRDLKPGNILVTAGGEPKLLDFGIAKLLDPGANVTQTMAIALTPQYASPEQVRGQSITTASDVYSLGVILYQLLTGRTPYTVETTTAFEMERVICQEPPASPGLGNELDDILMMALRKEPERRYASVTALADDLRRFTSGQPVLAAPDTFSYRTSKYIGRHWVGLAATAAAMLALCIGAGVAMYQAHIAKQRLAQVRKLANTFLFDFHDQIVNIAGTTAARAFVVKTAQGYLDDLSRSAGSDPELKAELAQAYLRVGDAQGRPRSPNLGDPVGAEASYLRSAALYRSIAPGHPQYAAAAVTSLSDLAFFYTDRVRYADADNALKEAFDLAAPLKSDPSAPALFALAQLYQTRADLAELDPTRGDLIGNNLQALDYIQRWARLQPASANASVSNRLGRAQIRLGRAYFAHGQLQQAETELLAAHRSASQAISADPQNTTYRFLAISTSLSLAELYSTEINPGLRQPANAAIYASEVVTLVAPLIAADANNFTSRYDSMTAQLDLAHSLFLQDPRHGLPELRRALTLWKDMQDSPRLNDIYHFAILDSLQHAEPVLSSLGAPGEAYTLAMENVAARRKLLSGRKVSDEDFWQLVRDLQFAAEAARVNHNEPEAQRLLQEGLRIAAPFAAAADRSMDRAIFAASFYNALSRDAAARSRCDEAVQWRQKEIAVWQPLSLSGGYPATRLAQIKTASPPCRK
jgi:eukaryotic-like serine/threonine-protein kinase